VIFECQKYEREREKMKEGIRMLGGQGNSLRELLGKSVNGVSALVFQFLKETGWIIIIIIIMSRRERGKNIIKILILV